MIIKESDGRAAEISALEGRLGGADGATRQRILADIRKIAAGQKGEKDAAYQIKIHYGANPNWMVLHGLRVEHDGVVAQIDHLLINRFLEFWVCETKHFAKGVAINAQGEFSSVGWGQAKGIASPIEQNANHIKILGRLLDTGIVPLPRRLGVTIRPTLKSVILVSREARIDRPTVLVKGIEEVIKDDQLNTTINRSFDTASPLLITRLIGIETLETVARAVAALHRPLVSDPIAPRKPRQSPITAHAKSKCSSCGIEVSSGIAGYCHERRNRFAGLVYCMPCQRGVGEVSATG